MFLKTDFIVHNGNINIIPINLLAEFIEKVRAILLLDHQPIAVSDSPQSILLSRYACK